MVDAASQKETVSTDSAKAEKLAKGFLEKTKGAKFKESRDKDLVRLRIEADKCSGQALMEGKKGRLVYLRYFPEPDQTEPNKKSWLRPPEIDVQQRQLDLQQVPGQKRRQRP